MMLYPSTPGNTGESAYKSNYYRELALTKNWTKDWGMVTNIEYLGGERTDEAIMMEILLYRIKECKIII